MTSRALTVLALALTLGCGSSSSSGSSSEGSTEGSGGETTTTTTTASTSGPPRPWDEMSGEERGHYMAEVVVPEMRTLFQAHDAERYANFGCATCHGENAHEVGFHMPNGLAPLEAAAIPSIFASSEPGAVFMTQTVWPRMAQLLGEEPYNMETHEGFRCFDCHAEAPASTTAMR